MMGVRVPSSFGGRFLDSETSPSQDLAGVELVDLNISADNAYKLNGVGELLLPLNVGGSRVRRRFQVGSIGRSYSISVLERASREC